MTNSKNYYWLRLKSDFFTSKEMKKLRKIAGGDTYTIIYLKLQLLSLRDDGKLYFDGIEESFAEELALMLDEDPDNVKFTLMFLEKCELLECESDTEIMLTEVPMLTGKESESAERVRRHRAKKQKTLQCNADVTECNGAVTECNTEKEIEIEIDNIESNKLLSCVGKRHDSDENCKNPNAKSDSGEPEEDKQTKKQREEAERQQLEHDFELIYKIYPKKKGRTVAFVNYTKWVSNTGKSVNGKRYKLTNKQIWAAVKRYVDEMEQTGKELEFWKNFDTLMGRQLLDYVRFDE